VPRTPRRAVLATSSLLLLLLAGCGSAPKPIVANPTEPAIGTIPHILDGSGLRLPVEEYLPTSSQEDRLGVADLVLIHDCMARFGIAYDVKPVLGSSYGPVSLTDRRYGITDATLAAHFGYGLGARDPALVPRPAKPQIGNAGVTALSGQGQSEVNGVAVPEGGCMGEADRTLNADVPASVDIRKGNELQFQSFSESRTDSRVVAVFRAWSACMARSGFHYADPLAAAGDPTFTGRPDAHQIAVALADISCKGETNLVGVWFTVESAYQRRAINADAAQYAAVGIAIMARDRSAARLATPAPSSG
jgi:hypothetical protein